VKVVIFAGGFGSRLSEETAMRPKPMVEIGGRPIIWHIMKIYAHHGFSDFVVLAGYKAEVIKLYFLNYTRLNSDFTIDLASGHIAWAENGAEPWRVTVLDTGNDTMTGGRLKRARQAIGDERFLLTYGDGLADVDLSKAVPSKVYLERVSAQAADPLAELDGSFDVRVEGATLADAAGASADFLRLREAFSHLPHIRGVDFQLASSPPAPDRSTATSTNAS